MAKYYERPITLRLTAYQRKVLSEIVDGALDAGAGKGGLTKIESNALSSVFMRLIGVSDKAEAAMRAAVDGSRSSLEQILKHVTAPKRIASERLDNIEAICRNALASPLPVESREWQPIETAPKDGTPMLFCNYDDPEQDVLPIVSGFWSRLSEGWYAELSGQKIKPTHWMRLLDPPFLSPVPPRNGTASETPDHRTGCTVTAAEGNTL